MSTTFLKKRLLPFLLILALTAFLALVVGGTARELLIAPIRRILWVWFLIFRAIPQPLFWAVLLTTTVFLAARSLIKLQKHRLRAEKTPMKHPRRVQLLARWIHYATRGYYFKRRLAQHLGELAVETLAYRRRLTGEQVREDLKADELDAPPDVRAYIQAATTRLSLTPAGLLSRLVRRVQLGAQASPLDIDPENVVRFLERQLEVQHDD
jgi:hypothetical protein